MSARIAAAMTTPTTYTEIREYDHLKAASDVNYNGTFLVTKPAFLSYDPKFKEILGSSPKITLVEQQDTKFAHEAGIYIASTNRNYFTSNYQSGKRVDIFSVSCADGDAGVTTHDLIKEGYPDVVNGNGGCHWDGKLLFCSQGSMTVPSALVVVDPATSRGRTVVNNFHGREFNSINDVVVHHGTGDIWFTDPTYGYEQAFRPSTGQLWVVADGFAQCNGLCFSPDYTRMYITDTGALQAHGTPGTGLNIGVNPRLPATVYVYDVGDEGTTLGNRRMFAYCDAGIPDGIKCDTQGNVYSGCGDGIHVWDSRGTLLGKIYVAGVVANFNFAKGGIWAFAEERLFHIEIGSKGALAKVEGFGE